MNTTKTSTLPSPRLELLILAVLAVITTIVFWSTDLDLKAAGWFYDATNSAKPWPHGDFWLWELFYDGVPVLAAVLVLGSLFILIYSSVRGKLRQYKLAAGCVLLTILLGPGLLVNAIFKDHWGRPRPNQIMEFGGTMQHVPPLMMGESRKGESFPSGHPSVGFSLIIFWLLLRGRKPRLAKAALFFALLTGGLMGVGRMAAGGHFLSDVLWSCYMTTFAAIMVFYYIVRVPQRRATTQRDDLSQNVKTPPWQIAAYVVVGAGVLVGSLVGFPLDQDYRSSVGVNDMPQAPQIITLTIDKADVELQLQSDDNPYLTIETAVRTFGLPTNEVHSSLDYSIDTVPQITYQLAHQGVYSEYNSVVKAKVAANALGHLVVRVQEGDIHVTQAPNLLHQPKLELSTDNGQVIQGAADSAIKP